MIMTHTFNKQDVNTEFDHQSSIVEMFGKMGFSDVSINTSTTNGLSHYVTLEVDVLNEGRTYADMMVFNNKTVVIVRISDHASGLEKNCGGVCGNKMTMQSFKKLIETGAIKSSN